MGRKEIEAEVLSELSKMDNEVSKQEPEVVEQIEKVEENDDTPVENTSQCQDVDKKSDGIGKEDRKSVV
jgi:hypothetical protein